MSLNYDLGFVRHRYNRVASIYPLLNLVFLLPFGIRARAMERLNLKTGDKVVEVGCGTGRNFPHLVRAVGPRGEIFGVDYCEGMLAKARKLCERHRWRNVTLLQHDAAELILPGPVEGILFSLSYTVIPKPRQALAQAWKYLRPNGRVVILDAKLAHGFLGKFSRPLVTLITEATVLGDPDEQPWEDLKVFTPQLEIEGFNLGTYYICRGKKRDCSKSS